MDALAKIMAIKYRALDSDVKVFFALVFSKKTKTWPQKKLLFLENFVVRGNTDCALLVDGFLL